MSVYFADTSYYVALLVPQDVAHRAAGKIAADPTISSVTTTEVLLEVAAFFSKPPLRSCVVGLVDDLRRAPTFRLIPSTSELFEEGWDLYRRHHDKSWSLTDCISFVTMRRERLLDALTTDRHFEQAGFRALLKEPLP